MFKSKRLSERQEGLNLFNEIITDKKNVLIIHYSCESFITSHGRTPRITSICIRNLATAQTKSFSIHFQAQLNGKDFTNLTMDEYDILEKQLLDEYYSFIRDNHEKKWLHWNMRDSNYGFEAIVNRYRILKGEPVNIPEDRKYDFPRIIGKIYTYNFETHKPKGRFLNLAESNDISTRDALTGEQEAEAFDNKEYLKLHLSTLRKADIIETIVSKIENGSLKVKSKWYEIYGLTISGIIEVVKNSWILLLFWALISYVIFAATEPVVQRLFGTAK